MLKKLPPLKYFFSPYRWKLYIIYRMKKYITKREGKYIPHLEEYELVQYAYRVAKCYECVENKTCINCSCDTIGAMNTRSALCSTKPFPKWGVFQTKEEWEEFKKSFKIEFKVEIKRK